MKKILVLLLACLSSSMLLAQNHYHPDTGVGELTMAGYCVVQINEVEQFSTDFELGIFLKDDLTVCRGAALVNSNYYNSLHHYFYLPTIYGESGEVMTFKLYNSDSGEELLTTDEFTFVPNGRLGYYTTPHYINFIPAAPQPTTYELEIPGYGSSTGGYYLIASPVTEEITPSTENGFVSGNFDLYYFDQNGDAQGNEWINYDPNAFNILSTKGYLYASESGTTLQFTGTPYNGNGIIPLDYSETNPSVNMRGWNLIGNPYNYLVSIDKDNYYIMNEDGDDIIVADGTPITPMQGFFVLATREGESVTLSEYQAPYVPLDGVVLNLSRNRGNTIDRAIVRLGEGSTMPKFMLNPNNSKIYIEQDGDDYAVVNSTANELPVSFKAASNGTYTLNVAVENTEMHYLHLIDNIAGTDTDLLANPSYTFEANTGDHANRFTLVMSSTVGVEEHFAFYNGHNWTVSNPSTGSGPATLQVIDMTGRLISTTTIDGTSQLDVNAASGVYMFRLVNGNDVKVQKVVVR